MTDNMRDDMAAEFDRLQTLDDEAVGLPATEETIVEDAAPEEESAAETGRDEKGRFKAKAEKPAEEIESTDTAVELAPAEEITDQGIEPVTEPALQPLSPPERWTAEWKAEFAALPREAQQLLLKREGEYDKGFTQKSQEAADYKRRYDPIDQILTPRRQQFAMQGMTEEQGLTQLFALSDFAASDPQGFIRMIAKNRGIDLATLIPTAEPEAPALSPEIAPLYNEVNSLKQFIQTQKQQQEQAEQRAVFATIESFKQEHPHFDECWNEMSHMIPAIKAGKPLATHAEILKDAYDRATWANPAVRQKLLETQQAAADAERAAADAKRAEEARQAEAKRIEQQKLDAAKALKAKGTTIATRAAVGTAKPAPGSLRDEMSRLYDELQGVA